MTFRAPDEVWQRIEQTTGPMTDLATALLELRDRLAALEAVATCPHIVTSDEGASYCGLAEQGANSQPTPNDRQIRSSAPTDGLMERVQRAIGHTYPDDACAGILACADWLSRQGVGAGTTAARWLREEVKRGQD